MMTAGIVAEYNPFHRGHAWHIARIRETLGADTAIVCVMSGHWVQRGECALTDKWRRAGLALAGGADLVLELPTPWAMASAEAFARGAVSLLEATGVVDVLSFGSESGQTAALARLARCLNSGAYQERLGEALKRGISFAAARQAAAEQILGKEAASPLSRPNDNLAVEYLRALPAGIGALAVRRIGAEHDGPAADGYASASAIRGMIRRGESAEEYLTAPWTGAAAQMDRIERAVLARLRTMTTEDFAALPDGAPAEGLPQRLYRAARQAGSLDAFYTLAKTKRYPHARLRRLALRAFLGIDAAACAGLPPYLRVLGFTPRGQVLLREMKGKAGLPVITKPARARQLPAAARACFEREERYTDLFGLCLPHALPCGLEWTCGPVRTCGREGERRDSHQRPSPDLRR